MEDDSEQATMIADCEARESKMSDWEREFVDSLGHRLARGDSLTIAQDAKLTQIWERIT